jgi:hypothetical protein
LKSHDYRLGEDQGINFFYFLKFSKCKIDVENGKTGRFKVPSLSYPHSIDKKIDVLMSGLQANGFKMTRNQTNCILCSDYAHGAFIAKTKSIFICSNNVTSYSHVRDVMTHELVHAFDNDQNFDKGSLKHHACTEIRAIHLAGDCGILKEFLGGQFRFRGMLEVDLKINRVELCKEKDRIVDEDGH